MSPSLRVLSSVLIWNRDFRLAFVSKGDENGCNLSPGLLGSPPKQSNLSLDSRRKLSLDENSPVSARCQLVPPSPRRQDTPCRSPAPQNPERKAAAARVPEKGESSSGSAQNVFRLKTKMQNFSGVLFCLVTESKFQSVKQALHTAIPDRLLAREAERDTIRSFLEEKVLQRRPGSLYISGAPGTGKTACFNCVLHEMKVPAAPVQPREAAGLDSCTINLDLPRGR